MTTNAVANLDTRGIMAAISKREPKQQVHFEVVPRSQWAIHERLENWARWCRGRQAPSSSPMFRMYRSPAMAREQYGATTKVSVDTHDAQKIHEGIKALKERYRAALNWYYLNPVKPSKACREIGTDMDGLYQLIFDARSMLMRGA